MLVLSRAFALTATLLAVVGQSLLTIPAGAAPPTAAPVEASAPWAAPSAARTWDPVKTLGRDPRGESLVVDARNNTTVVWATSSLSILALRHPAGGSWGRSRVIGHGYAPEAAVDARGNVTVVWLTKRPGYTDGVASARRPAGGRWSDPVRLSRDLRVPGYPDGGEGVYGAGAVDLAVSPVGAATVAWDWGSEDRGKASRIQSVYRRPGGPWGAPVDVTPASGAKQPHVGIDAHGTVVLVYEHQRSGHPQVLKARQRLVGDGWTEAVTVAAEGYNPSLRVDRAGDAVVAFTPDFVTVRAVSRPANGRWGAARTLSPAGVEINDFSLDMNGRGAALVALGRGNGRIDLVRRPPSGPWSGPVRVVATGSPVYDLVVALNGVGDTFLAWGAYAVHGKYRPHDDSWSPRFTLSPDTGVDVLEATFAEVAPNGDVAAMWQQEAQPLKVRLMRAS